MFFGALAGHDWMIAESPLIAQWQPAVGRTANVDPRQPDCKASP
jgi:hypothetical protein